MKILPLIAILLCPLQPSPIDGRVALTDNGLDNLGPVMTTGYLAWYAVDASGNYKVMLHDFDRNVSFQLSGEEGAHKYPSISDDLVAWLNEDSKEKSQIHYYDLRDALTMHIKNPGYRNKAPVVSGKIIAWPATREGQHYILLFNTEKRKKLRLHLSKPLVAFQQNGRYLLLEVQDENAYELVGYDLETHHSEELSRKTGASHEAMICGGNVIWIDEREQIVYFDRESQSARTISDPVHKNSNPCSNGKNIAWEAAGKSDTEIMLYDLATEEVRAVTTNNFDDIAPVLTDNHLVWMSDNGINSRYYFYHLEKEQLHQTKRGPNDRPEFQSAGNRLAWSLPSDDLHEIYIYDLE